MGDHRGNKERGPRRQLSFTWKDGNRELWEAAFERWTSNQRGRRLTAQDFIVHLIRLFGEADEASLERTVTDLATRFPSPSVKADAALFASIKRADMFALELAKAHTEAHELKKTNLELEGKLARQAMELEAEKSIAQDRGAELEVLKAELVEHSDLSEKTALLFRDMERRMSGMQGELKARKEQFAQLASALSARIAPAFMEEGVRRGDLITD